MSKSKIQNPKSKVKPVLPNSTIGVLGSGQLGRLFTIAARRMGYRVHTFSPESDTPTGQVADTEINADYEDLDAVRDFAKNVDVITFEFENVPLVTVETAEKYAPVRPRGEVLHLAQNRLREKTFLKTNNLPHTTFRRVQTLDELHESVLEIGTPCILKTAGFGYDGKGQTKIKSLEDCKSAFGETMKNAADILTDFGVSFETKVVSAHRTPDLLFDFAKSAEERGIEVIIAGAGGAAHLPGMCAAQTVLPVLGVPVQTKALSGMDSLLSIVQMPAGIPVGTLAIGNAGATNAALLAISILSNTRKDLREKLRKFREEQTKTVLESDLE